MPSVTTPTSNAVPPPRLKSHPPAPPRDPSPAIVRVLDVDEQGRVRVTKGTDLVRPPPEGTIRWVDLQDQDAPSLELLRDRFEFHPLAIEDCMHFDQRSKVEEYTESLFVVTHGAMMPEGGPLALLELHAFLGKTFLVTVHALPMPSVNAVWDRVAGDAGLARRGPDYLYYLVADATVDGLFPVLDHIGDRIEAIELSVLEDPTPDDLYEMFVLRRILSSLRRALSPQRDAFALLAKRGLQGGDRTAPYFRDVFDHVARLSESIDMHRDMLGNCFDAYLSGVSNKTNGVMKSLAIMSAIFLPLSFIVGFFGQNFDDFPLFPQWVHNDTLMWIMFASCVVVPMILIISFRRSGWW
jgi:magnesium transporter